MSTDPLMLSSLEKVTGAELKELRQRCMVLMQQDDEPTKFPGAQPVSFERKHLDASGTAPVSILASPYFAAEKTDGVRYMLMILGTKGAFTVDRNFDMRRLPGMRFPSRLNPSVALDSTLLDGELVVDKLAGGLKRPRPDGDGGEEPVERAPRLRFLAYDACRVASKACCDEPLRNRLMRLRREVLSPRYALSLAQPGVFDAEPFAVEQKDFFAMPQLPHIFSHVSVAPPGADILYAYNDPLRKLSHGNDGIIFTPARAPYRPYTCPSLLKWKPANMNSIDFRLQIKWRRESGKREPQARFTLCVATETVLMPYAWITFSDEDHARFLADPKCDSRIVECVYDRNWLTIEYDPNDDREKTWDNPRKTMGGWRFERIREDKKLPNDIMTVKSVEISVRDGVTAPELLAAMKINPSATALGAFAPGSAAHGSHGATADTDASAPRSVPPQTDATSAGKNS